MPNVARVWAADRRSSRRLGAQATRRAPEAPPSPGTKRGRSPLTIPFGARGGAAAILSYRGIPGAESESCRRRSWRSHPMRGDLVMTLDGIGAVRSLVIIGPADPIVGADRGRRIARTVPIAIDDPISGRLRTIDIPDPYIEDLIARRRLDRLPNRDHADVRRERRRAHWQYCGATVEIASPWTWSIVRE